MEREAANQSVARLKIEGLTKSFSGVRVLQDVSFEASAGEVLGLVGENGSGKSTTMNILAGIHRPDSGTLFVDGTVHAPSDRRAANDAGIAFIQQELNIFPNLTVMENLFLNRFPRPLAALPFLSLGSIRSRARKILDTVDLDVDPSAVASTLSPGERHLLEIARGVSADSHIMILDEPTTSLTQREIVRLFRLVERLKARGVTIIFISHSLDDVLHLSDRIVVMRDGRVTLRAENFGITARDLVIAMVGRSIETLFPVRQVKKRSNTPLLKVQGLGEPGVLGGIDLTVNRGEIVGVAGLMGSGRTELARTLFGLDPHSLGSIFMEGIELASGDVAARLSAGVGFLTEDRRHDGLMLDASVVDNMALAALPIFTKGIMRRVQSRCISAAAERLGRRLRLKSGDAENTYVRNLSGGNQQKVVLGRWLLCNLKLFILDEPTRGVDVGAKEEIYRVLVQLADEGVGILIISSELEELIGLCDRILVMRSGQLGEHFERVQFNPENILRAAFGPQEATA